MNILIDIGHPAHVHLFRNFITLMKLNGHKIVITTKKNSVIEQLLRLYGLDYIVIGEKKDSLILKYLSQILHLLNLLFIIKKNTIDIGMGVSMSLPILRKFTKIKVFGFDDDDIGATPVFAKFINQSDVILTPESLRHEKRGLNHITHAGYHELFYLHPNRFKPDIKQLSELQLKEGEKYFVFRFNAFKAHHDIGVQGLKIEQKIELVNYLSKFGRVFITTERDIEPELKQYQLILSPDKIHHLLYFATMFVGDSQTMTSEAALLGTPALKCNTFAGLLSIPNELENKYGLCFSYLPSDYNSLFSKIEQLLSLQDLKLIWGKKREKLLSEKIDVTAFLVWFIENYPKSKIDFIDNPDISEKFK